MEEKKRNLLSTPVEHLDIKAHDPRPLVEAMGKTAFQARNLHQAAQYLDQMQQDKDCVVFLTLAGSVVSAGMKRVVVDMVQANMVDAIVATGANIVDQDFFEALGFRHYQGQAYGVDDQELRALEIDRIYDTYIDEQDLRACDQTITDIAHSLEARPYSSREFIQQMGAFLERENAYRLSRENSIVYQAYQQQLPIFVPAFSDCSAGFGLIKHQHERPGAALSIDSARDFLEISRIKLQHPESGLFMIGGGVPKNFVQDIVVACDVLGQEVPMHKYAIQITVADERDGGLSGSTLKEACSWGKVDTVAEQMVYAEATLALPLVVGYAYHQGHWKARQPKALNQLFEQATA